MPHQTSGDCRKVAEGMGFEPMEAITRLKRLAGARTRPLCDPSLGRSIAEASQTDKGKSYNAICQHGPEVDYIRQLQYYVVAGSRGG